MEVGHVLVYENAAVVLSLAFALIEDVIVLSPTLSPLFRNIKMLLEAADLLWWQGVFPKAA